MRRAIIGYHVDEEGHWVAQLDCGHNQHLRHVPPWVNRPWVLDGKERKARLGALLNCVTCDEGAPRDRP